MATTQAPEVGTALATTESLALPGVSQKDYDAQEQFRRHLELAMPRIAALLPDGVNPRAIGAAVQNAVEANPDLLKCSPVSLVRSVLKLATLNLQIGISADIVPIGTKAECWVRVKGVVELAIRSGAIRWAKEGFVCTGDDFAHEENENGTRFSHTPRSAVKADASNVTHVYAIILLPDRTRIFEVWPIERVLAHKQQHAKQTGPGSVWAKHPLPMMAKTVVKAALRFAPLSPELARAMAEGDEIEGSFEVVREDPTQALIANQQSLNALNQLSDGTDDGASSITIEAARAMKIPGKAESWGGNGGKPLSEASDNLLDRIVKWIDDDSDRAAKFAQLREAVVMVENDRELSRMDGDDGGN